MNPSPASEPTREDGVLPAPWELAHAPFLVRFLLTWSLALRRPRGFFTRLDPGGEERVTSFAWLCIAPSMAISAAARWLAARALPASPLASDPAWAGTPFADIEVLRALYLGELLASPVVGLLAVHIAAGLYHVGLLLAGGRDRPYIATFRATAFGMAPMVWWALPIVGPFVAAAWTAWLHAVALARVQRVPTAIAAAIVVGMWLAFALVAATSLGAILRAGGWAPNLSGT
jgi:hypothetical protein